MDSLFHFVFAFIAGMAVNAKLDHKPLWVVLAALSAVFIDVDHLLYIAGVVPYSRSLHTLFVTFLLPLVLFYAVYRYERGKDSIKYQSLSLLIFVMLVGHVVADLFNEGAVPLLYPLYNNLFSIPQYWNVSVVRETWYIVTPESLSLAFYGVIIGLAYYAEEFIYFFEQRHESAANALRDALNT